MYDEKRNLMMFKLKGCSYAVRLFLLMFFVFSVSTFSFASAQNISLNMHNAKLVEVFKSIERQSSLSFLFNNKDVENVTIQNLNVSNTDVEDVLKTCLNGTSLSWERDGSMFIIKRISPTKQTQDLITITGKIKDNNGEPVIGATVVVRGANMGVASNEKGEYKITIPNDVNITLVFSCVGMIKREVKYNGDKVMNVTLQIDEQEIEEVIVNGYVTMSKRESAGAVKQLKAADIMQNSNFSISQMLEGQVAGMNVMINSGEPSATPKIRIRGTSSIVATKAPLWVLDGIILDDPVNVDYSDLNGDDAQYLIGNAIAGINPQDIENITVLKDASAAAIYGVQAANGVIVVTTKKGRAGRPTVRYSGTLAVSTRDNYGSLNLMNASERVQLSREIIDACLLYPRIPTQLGYEGLYMKYLNKDLDAAQFQNEVDKMIERNTDWFDILFRNPVSNNHTLSISGGDQFTTYYGSIGYNNSLGTAKGSDSKRYNVALKLTSWVTPKLYVGLQVNGQMSNSNGFHSSINPKSIATTISRTIPCYEDNGDLFFLEVANQDSRWKESLTTNYVNELNNTGNSGKITSITAKLDAQWKFWKGFRYDFSGSIVQQKTNSETWANDKSYYVASIRKYNYGSTTPGDAWELESPLPYGGVISKGDTERTSYTFKNQINYNGIFNEQHVLGISAISEIRSVKTDGLNGTYYGWMPDRGQIISPTLTGNYKTSTYLVSPTISDNIRNTVSWIGTGSYSYMDKYVFNANIRADGSNQFGSNPKYRFLPVWSVAGKWTISNENFLKGNNTLTYLALRASYGVQGNVDQSTSPDLVIRIGGINAYTFLPESYTQYLPNPDLRWEKTTSYNFGLDFNLWRNRISGTVDVYKKMGSDMIMSKVISGVNGVTSQKINAADLTNSGVEVEVYTYPLKRKDYEIRFGIQFAYNKNKLTKANFPEYVTDDERLNGTALVEGQPLSTIYSYEYAGLDHDYGLPIFYDKNHKSTVNLNGVEVPNYSIYKDEVSIVKSGTLVSPTTGALKLSGRYKNLRINMNFTYALGGVNRLPSMYDGVFSSNSSAYQSVFDPLVNVSKEVIDRWKNPGDEAHTDIPALTDPYTYNNLDTRAYEAGRDEVFGRNLYDRSDVRVAKTNNIRLSSLNLSYYLPKVWMETIGIKDVSVGFQMTNLFLITSKKWHGLDPQTLSANSSIPKTFTFNLNVNF